MKSGVLRRAVALLAGGVLACASTSAVAQVGLTVSAVVVSKANCRFNTTALVLDFLTIDPASAVTATASAVGSVTCTGGKDRTITMGFNLGDGLYATGKGARRMRHTVTTTEHLAYGLSITPAFAQIDRNSTLAFEVKGSILSSQYRDVMAGSYSDRVAITLAP